MVKKNRTQNVKIFEWEFRVLGYLTELLLCLNAHILSHSSVAQFYFF